MLIKYAFIIFACILAFMISIYKLVIQKRKRTSKTAEYVTVVVWAFALYILSALFLAFFMDGVLNKAMLVLFALSPFIIGKFATYEKERIYSFIQIFCAIISAVYIYLV